MSDIIYRDQAIEAISKLPVKVDNLGYTWMIAGDVLKQIDDIPSAGQERTAKVQRNRYGRTIDYYFDGVCECGYCVDSFWQYCPSCGVKLDWSKE